MRVPVFVDYLDLFDPFLFCLHWTLPLKTETCAVAFPTIESVLKAIGIWAQDNRLTPQQLLAIVEAGNLACNQLRPEWVEKPMAVQWDWSRKSGSLKR